MKIATALAAMMLVCVVGCGAPPAEPSLKNIQPDRKTMPTTDSSFTWGYFVEADEAAVVRTLVGERKAGLTKYRVDKVETVVGTPGISVEPGKTVFRLEAMAKIDPASPPRLLFQGVPQHLEYTSKSQRDDLKKSRGELPASKDTVAVVIPIRKSAAWWALPQDERVAHFNKRDDKAGHTAIGADYVDRIYRKLYHTRYSVESTDHDFITYFEFDRADTDGFKMLLAKLRDPAKNPEWTFVDREYEIWMTKLE